MIYKIPIKANEAWIDDLCFGAKVCTVSSTHGLNHNDFGCTTILCSSCLFYRENIEEILHEQKIQDTN